MDYLVCIDSYGQPYLQHWAHYGNKKNHKYVARINTPKGWRYFYTMKEFEAYKKQEAKKQEKAKNRSENYNKVSIKDYLTGGSQQDDYRSTKKNIAKKEREAKRATRQANRLEKKAERQTKKAEAKSPYSASRRKHEEKAKNFQAKADAKNRKSSNARLTAEVYKRTLSSLEREYESTSLPGRVHRTGRKVSEALSRVMSRVGNTYVSAINTPSIYVKKS